MFGIDVSKWNGSNDFARAKNDGVEFVIIRANYGYSDYFKNCGYDPYFNDNYNNSKNVGLKIGAYCYNYANTIAQARQEAYRTLKALDNRDIDIAVFCDAEDKEFLKGDNVTEKIIAYLKIIKNAGYEVGVYANLNWFTNYIDLDKIRNELGEVVTWIAHYNKNLYNSDPNHYKGMFDIWQYGSEGYKVDGISGYGGGISYVDVNISYTDFDSFNLKTGWLKDDTGWYYVNEDGSYKYNEWVHYNDKWYYINNYGYMITNKWLLYKEEWYYFNKDGEMVTNSWLNISDETFYLNDWGTCHLNSVEKIDNKMYAFNERGALITNKTIDENGEIK